MEQSKIPWIAAAFAVSTAIFSFNNLQSTQQTLAQVQQQFSEASAQVDEANKQVHEAADSLEYNNRLEKVAQLIIKGLNDSFGQGTKAYYPDKKILLLNANGEPDKITVRCTLDGTSSFRFLGDEFNDDKFGTRWSRDLKAQWNSKKFKDGKADLIITPGSSRGYNIIHFFNEKHSDAFDVLIIVD